MVRAQREALLAALVLAFMPISSSATSPGPHSPLWARARGRAEPALVLLRPPLGSAHVCTCRDGSPWGHMCTAAGGKRHAKYHSIPGEEGAAGERFGDDSCERPSGAEGELLAGIA
ncbi:hypothetical protein T484DRAFT_1900702 [Baffinella frigidus]|nr:hypothetical protein T484DRAFT_1900702 [Cryptophyta sp. CCMP2293]